MKIKHKLVISFTISILMIIFIGVFLILFLDKNYISMKYKNANNYYANNDVTVDEYAQYLIDKGFIVTRKEVQAYSGELLEVCHKEDEQIVIYEGGAPVLYGIINEKIITDFLDMISLIIGLIILFIILILLFIHTYIYKEIVNKIEILESNMKNYTDLDQNQLEKILKNLNKQKTKDELQALEFEFYTMLLKILNNQEQKEKLILMLSHELKTPLTKIEAIMDMYIQNFEGYNEKEKVSELIVQESHKMNKTINELLMFYKTNYSQEKKDVNIQDLIKEIFDDEIFKNKEVTININEIGNIKVEIEKDKLKILLNNIKNNIYKYSRNKSEVTIEVYNDKIIFKNNTNEETTSKTSTRVGNIINDHLASEIDIQIMNEIKESKYITIVSFKI